MSAELALRDFNIAEADWGIHGNQMSSLRRLVFIVEQNVPEEEEWDGKDPTAWHWIATGEDDVPVGTGRLLPDGQIGRMAVLAKYRGRGIGAAILEAAVAKARYLGMSSVFLHAQTHALDFYRKAQFTDEGPLFDEAGIEHQGMRRQLPASSDGVASTFRAADNIPDIGLQDFVTAEADWQSDGRIIRTLRGPAWTDDDLDDGAIHWHCQDPSGLTLGSIRMQVDGRIDQLHVLDEAAATGVAEALVNATTLKGQRFNLERVFADFADNGTAVFARCGFVPDESGESVAAGQKRYYYEIDLERVHEESRPAASRAALDGSDFDERTDAYQLAEDKDLILLRKEDDFRHICLAMATQATHHVRIFSPWLDHKLYDNGPIADALAVLARRNKYSHIEILVYDSHRIVKNGHRLMELARRVPSSMAMRIVHPELRTSNQEFMLADKSGMAFRQEYDTYEGYGYFHNVSEANRLARLFQRAWDSSLSDPYLRQLKI
jgi:predicted GNAT family N-acyltransferase